MRRIALSFALAGVLALGACGGEASPKPAPLTKTPESSAQSAEAFIGAFVRELNTASRTLDTTAWRQQFSPSCNYCANIARVLDSIRANGGSFESTGWSLLSATATTTDSTTSSVRATVSIPPQTVVYRRGGKTEKFDGEKSAARDFVVKRRDRSWVVVSMKVGT